CSRKERECRDNGGCGETARTIRGKTRKDWPDDLTKAEGGSHKCKRAAWIAYGASAGPHQPRVVGHATLASTPAASTMQAIANAAGMPIGWERRGHKVTGGTAAKTEANQMTGSKERIVGVALTMATRKVAVMT